MSTPPIFYYLPFIKCCMHVCFSHGLNTFIWKTIKYDLLFWLASMWPFRYYIYFTTLWSEELKSRTWLCIGLYELLLLDFVSLNTEFSSPPVGLGHGLRIIILINLPNDTNAILRYLGFGNHWSRALFSKISSIKLVPCKEGQTFCIFHNHPWKVTMHVILFKSS